ncbi:MAG: RluA family pseudouridine synthase [Candidatus Paceibacterota bacterium]
MSNKAIENIKILYEDKDCLVVDKPPGLMVHSDGRAEGPFLTDWIVKHYPETVDVGDPMTDQEGKPVNRAGIVHRLDRETSGVLIIAKNSEGHANLKKQFKDRTISKRYLTFVWGDMKEEFGTINRPIGRCGGDFRKYSAQRGARGEMKTAETYWTKKGNGKWADPKNPDAKEEKFSFVEVEPKTGRTHQIRVHFNAVNHPVVADSLYAPKRPTALGFERLALHSRSIEFVTIEGKTVKVSAPLPKDFETALKALGIESLSSI